ncbi:MAG: methyltransferase domain-containing protein [Candidatus Promineifilaceae bacterium]
MNFTQTDENKYLREQYKTQDNLQVRIQTHEKYTQPKIDFNAFVLDQISWSGQETVIDVGCGAGVYVESAQQRGGAYYACDLSFGMLQGLNRPGLSRVNLDAQQLPFAEETADVIFANHMLYHVPDQGAAVREIRRVLRLGGYLLAATNSANNMPELSDLRSAVFQHFGISATNVPSKPSLTFTLESGHELLGRHFSAVQRHDHPSALIFPESQPIIDYLSSSKGYYIGYFPKEIKWAEVEDVIRQEVDNHIAQHGTFRVNKLTGVFVCQKR